MNVKYHENNKRGNISLKFPIRVILSKQLKKYEKYTLHIKNTDHFN